MAAVTTQPLAGVRHLGCKGMKLSEMSRECTSPSRSNAAPGRFSLSADGQCPLCRSRPQSARQQRGLCDLFRTGRVTLVKDRSFGLMPPGWAGYWCASTSIFVPNCAGPAQLKWGSGREIRANIRDVRSSGVFRGQVRGVGAIGNGADRRNHTQTDAADRRDHRNFQRWLRRGMDGV